MDGQGDIFIADTGHNRVREVKPDGTITTIAGTGTYGYSGDGGPATAAELSGPDALAVDTNGDLFIVDTGNEVVREVKPDGIITTVAGPGPGGDGGPASKASLGLGYNSGIAVDAHGDLFIADTSGDRIREVTPNGIITTVAGMGVVCCGSGDGGPATSAGVPSPTGVAVDGQGDLFFTQSDNPAIREVTNGIITTVFQSGYGFNGGLAVDGQGDLFFSQYYVGTNGQYDTVINELLHNGTIITIGGTAGYSGDGGPAANAQFDRSSAVAVDGHGDLFIADSGNNRIREVTPGSDGLPSDGTIDTVAGGGSALIYSGDGGSATAATLNDPTGAAVDDDGNVFIADSGDNVVREVTRVGIITTIAGDGTAGYSGDGGPAAAAELDVPTGVAVDGSGDLFIADAGGIRTRTVTPGPDGLLSDGTITTVDYAGSFPTAAVDAQGDRFTAVGDTVSEATSSGSITTVAGNAMAGYSGDGGPATAASLDNPTGLAVDAQGDLFIADTSNSVVRRVGIGAAVTISTPTITSVTASSQTPIYGQLVTFTAAVAAQNPGAGTPAGGTVTFYNGTTLLGTVSLNQGIATLPPSTLTLGSHTISAVYSGAPYYFGSSSGAGACASSITILPAGSTTTLTTALTASTSGLVATPDTELVTLQATVAPQQALSLAAPTGTVQFLINGSDIGAPEPVSSGTATIALNSLQAVELNSYGASAIYTSDSADFIGSTGTLPATVTGPTATVATETAVTASSAASVSGQAVTFRATVTAQLPSTATPTGGIVTFYDGTTVLGADTLSEGLATLTTTSLGLGAQTISAVYSGDGQTFAGSSSGTITTVAGNLTAGYTGDDGPATVASLNHPGGVAVDAQGDLFIADTGNNVIREVKPDGTIITVAGNGTAGYSGDGGPATNASLNDPRGLAVDAGGPLHCRQGKRRRSRGDRGDRQDHDRVGPSWAVAPPNRRGGGVRGRAALPVHRRWVQRRRRGFPKWCLHQRRRRLHQ